MISIWTLFLLGSLQSLEDIRFNSVIEQQHAFTCGIASVSSIASIYWGVEVTEGQLIEILFDSSESTQENRRDITMYDLKKLLVSLGFSAEGFKLSYKQLKEARKQYGPLIIHLSEDDGHFALFLGEVSGFAVVGDPSRGCIALAVEEFLASWTHMAIAVFHPDHRLNSEALTKALVETAGRLESLRLWSVR